MEKYIAPKIEVKSFTTEDAITVSVVAESNINVANADEGFTVIPFNQI